MKRTRKSWYIVAMAWLVAGLLFTLQSYHYRVNVGMPVDIGQLVILDFGYFLLWGLLSPFLILFFLKWPIDRQTWKMRMPTHVAAALVIAFVHRGIYEVGSTSLRGRSFSWDSWYASTVGAFDFGVLVYLTVLFITHSIIYYQRMQQERFHSNQLKSELANAQLLAIRQQLQPHFLFNALNTISAYVTSDPAIAKALVSQLGELLRHSLEIGQADEVPVETEMKFVRLYLQIQRTRFGDRLEIDEIVDPDAQKALVPSLLMSPLLENAVKYGIGLVPGKGYVHLRICKDHEKLNIAITNNCNEISNDTNRGLGIGLSSTKDRLGKLYGDCHDFHMAIVRGVCEVTVVIPYRIGDSRRP